MSLIKFVKVLITLENCFPIFAGQKKHHIDVIANMKCLSVELFSETVKSFQSCQSPVSSSTQTSNLLKNQDC